MDKTTQQLEVFMHSLENTPGDAFAYNTAFQSDKLRWMFIDVLMTRFALRLCGFHIVTVLPMDPYLLCIRADKDGH
jgi:hypothetical protein